MELPFVRPNGSIGGSSVCRHSQVSCGNLDSSEVSVASWMEGPSVTSPEGRLDQHLHEIDMGKLRESEQSISRMQELASGMDAVYCRLKNANRQGRRKSYLHTRGHEGEISELRGLFDRPASGRTRHASQPISREEGMDVVGSLLDSGTVDGIFVSSSPHNQQMQLALLIEAMKGKDGLRILEMVGGRIMHALSGGAGRELVAEFHSVAAELLMQGEVVREAEVLSHLREAASLCLLQAQMLRGMGQRSESVRIATQCLDYLDVRSFFLTTRGVKAKDLRLRCTAEALAGTHITPSNRGGRVGPMARGGGPRSPSVAASTCFWGTVGMGPDFPLVLKPTLPPEPQRGFARTQRTVPSQGLPDIRGQV